jgi:hypothetical protein
VRCKVFFLNSPFQSQSSDGRQSWGGSGWIHTTLKYFRKASLWCPNPPCGHVVVTESSKESVSGTDPTRCKKTPYTLTYRTLTHNCSYSTELYLGFGKFTKQNFCVKRILDSSFDAWNSVPTSQKTHCFPIIRINRLMMFRMNNCCLFW